MNKYRIPSVANACAIFQLLTTSKKIMSASTIAKELELPRTSVFRVLKTLEEEGMVLAISNGYVMGHRLINIGLQATSQIPERRLCVPVLQELTNLTGESSHFAILSGKNALLMEVCDSPHALRVASRPGTLTDIHSSAAGKCFLAYAPEAMREGLLERIVYNKHTEKTHLDADSLRSEFDQVKELGYAVDDEEYHDNVRCIAVPVMNSLGQVTGAIGITAAKSRLTKAQYPKVVKIVKNAAQQLSDQFKK